MELKPRRWPLRVCLLALAALVAAGAGARPAAASPPPLIDRNLFFGDPELSGAQLSPDGRWLSFVKPYAGARNLWVKGVDEPFAAARPVTADKRPVPSYFWSRDGHYLLYVQDRNGDENFHVWAVDPAGAPEGEAKVPAARDLTPVPGVRAQILSVPRDAPGQLLVGLNDRDPRFHDIWQVDIATGGRTLVRENKEEVGGWVFDNDGRLRLAWKERPGGGGDLLRVGLQGLEPIASTTFEETLTPLQFHPDGRRVYVSTNAGADVDLERLMLLDVESGTWEMVEQDPDSEVDLGNAVFHPLTDELLATSYEGDRQRVYPKNDEARRLWAGLRAALPEGELDITSVTDDLKHVLVAVHSDVDPGSVYQYDAASGKAALVYRSRPDLPSQDLAPMRPVTFAARDGMRIHAYLTLPKGLGEKDLPVVMYIHGGPWARDHWGYEPYAQFLANRGYAVMQVNYRASTGYGKKYLNAGNHEWGTGAMQNDVTDAVKWLIAQGIADPKRVGIFGGSYGGYATLAGVTYTPDLYACGVPYVGPSNLVTLIESFPEYWKPFLEGSFYRRVGNPSVESERQDLLARSPLLRCDEIKAPLLVVHGANDPRVKQRESDQIVVALRQKGKAVEYLVAPDEGHGFRAPGNRLALAAAMEKFLAKHLGGRCQEGLDEATAKALAAITVDVTKVAAPAAEGAGATGGGAR